MRVGDATVRTLGGYIRGTAIVAAVDAVFIGIGLAIVGVPLALPLAVVVFLLAGLTGAVLAVPIAASIWRSIQVWDGADKPATFARKKERSAVALPR